MSDYFGIDVGTGSIRLVKIHREGTKLVLDSFGEIKAPASNWAQAGDKGLEVTANAIKSLVSDLKLKTKQVVAALNEDEVVSRLVSLPPLKDSEVKDALYFEAETFVPYPLDQVSIDYEVVNKGEDGKMLVFVIAARNDSVEKYVKLIKMANLSLMALESPALSLRRIANVVTDTSKPILLLDFGEKYSSLMMIYNGFIYTTRNFPIGGDSFTRAISVSLGLDLASAEEYKKAYGLKDNELEGKIRAVLMPLYTSILDELRKASVSFRTEYGAAVELVLLMGGSSNMPGFAEELTKTLGVEVQVVRPFSKVDTTRLTVPLDSSTQGSGFSLAAGLALRDLL